MKLAAQADLELDAERALLLRQLSKYYIQPHYPEDILKVARGISMEHAQDVLRRTKALLQWLTSMK